MLNFEIKSMHTECWQEVSEVTALRTLEKNFERITPKITEMLSGKEIMTPEVMIRIKNKGMENIKTT